MFTPLDQDIQSVAAWSHFKLHLHYTNTAHLEYRSIQLLASFIDLTAKRDPGDPMEILQRKQRSLSSQGDGSANGI